MAKKRIIRKIRKSTAPKNCYFCLEKKSPEFSDIQTLNRFITERGKIIPRSRSGLCAKHQKKLAREIKYSRHLALLPFMVRV
ncbi:MAG: 30S ribosomal protein S18 [Candidatus Levybacteria bacterium CG10_big_fil_rev_8_21_14_0_10_35_13]|nr:MAG: 30S ribosomal protein S18 [Candidatus Levybacteria bacterium CG10_big_fil_rev_8_21_14_0_10_35_13]